MKFASTVVYVSNNICPTRQCIRSFICFGEINKRWRKLKGQSRMDIPETRATLGTRHNLKKRNKIKKNTTRTTKKMSNKHGSRQKNGCEPRHS